jgi:hypothetical protein
MKTKMSSKGQIVQSPNEGLVDWLLACPSKGYFVPVETGLHVLDPFAG